MPGTPQDPKHPLPQRVVPQTRTGPIDPDEIYDMTIGPGDSAVKAAYARTGRGTQFLGSAALAARPQAQQAEPSDALVIARRARRARSLTFTVQGIMWRAGFAPNIQQTPLGQSTPFARLEDKEVKAPSGAILRPVDASFELVFRELIPKPLTDQSDHMFGPVRKLERISLYYFPTGEGATAGLMAQYCEQATSRPHVLYLQTNIKQASPTVLDQIHKTFSSAVPRAVEAARRPKTGSFWEELDKAAYQVSATFKNSHLGGNTKAATSKLQKTARKASGGGVNRAFSVVDAVGKFFDDLAKIPGQMGISIVRGISGVLVNVIQALDKMAQPKS